MKNKSRDTSGNIASIPPIFASRSEPPPRAPSDNRQGIFFFLLISPNFPYFSVHFPPNFANFRWGSNKRRDFGAVSLLFLLDHDLGLSFFLLFFFVDFLAHSSVRVLDFLLFLFLFGSPVLVL